MTLTGIHETNRMVIYMIDIMAMIISMRIFMVMNSNNMTYW